MLHGTYGLRDDQQFNDNGSAPQRRTDKNFKFYSGDL